MQTSESLSKFSQSDAIYFDNNSTSAIFGQVAAEMASCINIPFNPSALHSYGRQAKALVDSARSKVKSAVFANKEYKVIFTASGTESNNLALRGVGLPVITVASEHASVFNVVGKGIIPIDRNGIVDLEQFEKILHSLGQRVLVSVMLANNETGVIQPISEIVSIAKKYNCLVHTDAVQAFGKISFDISSLGIDLLTISGHKFGGPVGAGALFVKEGIDLQPIIIGGGQEYNIRSGSQNVIAIHGLGIASEIATEKLSKYQIISKLRDYLEGEIQSISPDSIIFGKNAIRIPNTSCFTMPGVKSETQIIHFDLNGISISAGSACSSLRLDYPRVQIAMGYSSEVGTESIRVSLGRHNTMQEINYFIEKWKQLYTNSKVTKAAI